MIIPTNVTDYSRSDTELLLFAIFAASVAGKNSDQVAQKCDALWKDRDTYFILLEQRASAPRDDSQHSFYLEKIQVLLRRHKFGQYERLSRVIYWLNQHKSRLDTVTFHDLVSIKGIGPKTAAFFLLHSRRSATIPVIDTHICKFMASRGIEMKVTSDIQKYLKNAELVRSQLTECYPAMSLAEADLKVWTEFSGRGGLEKVTANDLRQTFGDPGERNV